MSKSSDTHNIQLSALETICGMQNYTYVFDDEEHRDHCAALDDFNNAVERAKEQK